MTRWLDDGGVRERPPGTAVGGRRRRPVDAPGPHDHAVFDLGIAIVSGRLPEGVPLPERKLGRMLGVSRTVVARR